MLYQLGEFELDTLRGTLRKGRSEIHLRPKTYAVLRYLVERRHQLISQNELLAAVWSGRRIEKQGIFQSIAEIRSAFSGHEVIRTVRGRGYQWVHPTKATRTTRRALWLPLFRAAALLLAITILHADHPRLDQTGLAEAQETLLAAARQHLTHGSLGDAETSFQKLLTFNPDHLAARLDLAQVYQRQGLLLRSATYAHKVRQDAIEYGTPFEQMASALMIGEIEAASGRLTDAAYFATETASIASRIQNAAYAGRAHGLLGEIWLETGRDELARTHLTLALDSLQGQCPESEARYREMLRAVAAG